ncbi:Os05g0412150 [Oryza sativa Japonica Group]|uniref:Os05g0412150 protein n=1 Tax=Oryza sativa subsp. japonica TaxID=39947 RepID=A0A0P0WMJ2_ORYSJ|nr:Os05g0412150 [Oryza sativa Japonica Group]
MAQAAKTSTPPPTQAPCTTASTGFCAPLASPGWCGGAPWPRALGHRRQRGGGRGGVVGELAAESTMAGAEVRAGV